MSFFIGASPEELAAEQRRKREEQRRFLEVKLDCVFVLPQPEVKLLNTPCRNKSKKSNAEILRHQEQPQEQPQELRPQQKDMAQALPSPMVNHSNRLFPRHPHLHKLLVPPRPE